MILIVDDDSAVRSSLSFMLKRAGYDWIEESAGKKEWTSGSLSEKENHITGIIFSDALELIPTIHL